MESESPNAAPVIPQALWIWDNQARRSLGRGTLAWLFFLVLIILTAVCFQETSAASWLIGGFVTSHLIVFGLGLLRATVRRGLVSLTHLVCWGPGWLMLIQSRMTTDDHSLFTLWSSVCILLIGVSFLFDLRDGGIYLISVLTGRLPNRETTLAGQTDRSSQRVPTREA